MYIELEKLWEGISNVVAIERNNKTWAFLYQRSIDFNYRFNGNPCEKCHQDRI